MEANYIVHADITVKNIASAVKYFETTAPSAQVTLDLKFWYNALMRIPEQIKPKQNLSDFFTEIRDRVKSSPWYNEINEWKMARKENFVMSNMRSEIKNIIIEDYKSKQQPTLTVDDLHK